MCHFRDEAGYVHSDDWTEAGGLKLLPRFRWRPTLYHVSEHVTLCVTIGRPLIFPIVFLSPFLFRRSVRLRRRLVTEVMLVRSDTVDAKRGRARGQRLSTYLPPPQRLPRQLHLGHGRLHRLEVPQQVYHRQPISSCLLYHQGENYTPVFNVHVLPSFLGCSGVHLEQSGITNACLGKTITKVVIDQGVEVKGILEIGNFNKN